MTHFLFVFGEGGCVSGKGLQYIHTKLLYHLKLDIEHRAKYAKFDVQEN